MSDLQSMHTQARKLILMISAGVERLEAAEQVFSTTWWTTFHSTFLTEHTHS